MGGLDSAAYYFDRDILGSSESAFSRELKKLTEKKSNKNYQLVVAKIESLIIKLGISDASQPS